MDKQAGITNAALYPFASGFYSVPGSRSQDLQERPARLCLVASAIAPRKRTQLRWPGETSPSPGSISHLEGKTSRSTSPEPSFFGGNTT